MKHRQLLHGGAGAMSEVLPQRATRPSQVVFPGRGWGWGLAVLTASDGGGGEARLLAGGPHAQPAPGCPWGRGRECS